MKWRMGILLLAAAFLAGLLLVPGRLLAVQEQRLYGRKTAQDVLSPQFAADTGTLFQRLNTLAQYHQVTYLSLQAGSDLYYDQETLLELYRQELSTLAQTNELAASLLPALEDLLERQRLYQDALEVGYACVVDLSTGNSFLVSYLRSNDLVFALEMDMTSPCIMSFHGPTGSLVTICAKEVPQFSIFGK